VSDDDKAAAADLRTVVDALVREAVGTSGFPGGQAVLPSREVVIQIVEERHLLDVPLTPRIITE
jgi:hypothetical protein